MIIENEFFHQGILRWNLGWATPNYAGAFVVTLLCLLWAIRGAWVGRAVGLALELAGYFLLAKTFSRGALVALAIAAVFFLGTMGFRYLMRESGSGRRQVLRVCCPNRFRI